MLTVYVIIKVDNGVFLFLVNIRLIDLAAVLVNSAKHYDRVPSLLKQQDKTVVYLVSNLLLPKSDLQILL